MDTIAVLGISAFYHDSAAALIIDGEIVAAAQEERFSRIKHDSTFPVNAINYVLNESGISFEKINAVVFYDKPFLKFERLLETYHAFAPFGLRSFITSMPVWIKEKIFMRRLLRKQLSAFGSFNGQLLFTEHHLSHAASAFYPSPFNTSAILTLDGVGEWATATIGKGNQNNIHIIKEMHYPHSVGLLYSAFTYFLGFKVNSGEYKLMGLSPYGDPEASQTIEFCEKIRSAIVDIREDGSILLNMDYFSFNTDLKMIHTPKWESLFGINRREPESEIRQSHMNLAAAIQLVTEEIILKLVKTTKEITGCNKLVMAGGIALNCVANSKIASSKLFEDMWIQPAAGDAGGALGAALSGYYIYYKSKRKILPDTDTMKNTYLGPEYTDSDILRFLKRQGASYIHYPDFDSLSEMISSKLAEGNIIGWFQGRMEFGPRALGNRSILADPRSPDIQRILNLKIKFRESFRPFAPSVLAEDVNQFFSSSRISPYMLFTDQLRNELKYPQLENNEKTSLYDKLYYLRSGIPAVTHVDYSARVQTVIRDTNPRFWKLLSDFKKLTGIGMLVNTSYNIRGEPIVCTPEDAYRDFMYAGIDFLVIGNFVLRHKEQKPMDQNTMTIINSD